LLIYAYFDSSQEKENLWTGEHPIKTDEKKFEYIYSVTKKSGEIIFEQIGGSHNCRSYKPKGT